MVFAEVVVNKMNQFIVNTTNVRVTIIVVRAVHKKNKWKNPYNMFVLLINKKV